MKVARTTLIAVACAVSRLGAQSPGAVLPRAAASPDRYAGNCPAKIEFVGHVTTTVPGTVISYRWERSNGDSSKLFRAQIGSATAGDTSHARVTVAVPSDVWRLALPGQSGVFWEVLHVESPFDIRSAPARVAVECRA